MFYGGFFPELILMEFVQIIKNILKNKPQKSVEYKPVKYSESFILESNWP
jgi:hypothetical protein